MSIKDDLIGEQFVKGNLQKGLQTYRIYYYPPEVNYPTSKVWIYFNRKQDDKLLGIKSLCFSNIENHRNFILNNLLYQIYWLEKQGENFKPTWMDIHTYRMKLFEAVLFDLRTKLLKKVKEKLNINLTVNR